MSTQRRHGPGWVAIGDAAGLVNPMNGEGIDYAYETGRLASGYIADAIAGNAGALRGYSAAIDDIYSDYLRVARRFAMVIGYPAVIRRLTHIGMRSRPLMEWAFKVMANLLEPEEKGLTERIYGAVESIVRVTPDPLIK